MRFIVLLAGGMAWAPPPRSLCTPVTTPSTRSCYNGRDRHCGRCGTCVERAEAFRDAGLTDPTEYEETTE